MSSLTNFESAKAVIAEGNENALFANGFDAAVIGYVEQAGRPTVVLYDKLKCIKILVDRDKMTEEEAIEYVDFNVLGAYVGDNTPAFATLLLQEDK